MNDDNPLELEEMAEKKLSSGETLTMSKTKSGYDVDCWDSEGQNRWNRFFFDIDKAQAEYNRWN